MSQTDDNGVEELGTHINIVKKIVVMSGFIYGFIDGTKYEDIVTTPLCTVFRCSMNGLLYAFLSRGLSGFLPYWFKLTIPVALIISTYYKYTKI
jgi:hypothetical protein